MSKIQEIGLLGISEIKYLQTVLKFTIWQISKVTGYKRYIVETVCTCKKYENVDIPQEYRVVFDQRYGRA